MDRATRVRVVNTLVGTAAMVVVALLIGTSSVQASAPTASPTRVTALTATPPAGTPDQGTSAPEEESSAPEGESSSEITAPPPTVDSSPEPTTPTTNATAADPAGSLTPHSTGPAVDTSERSSGIPAVSSTDHGPTISWVIAVAVLLLGAGVLLWARRHEPPPPPQLPAEAEPADSTLAALEVLGEAMTDAGYSVSTVREVLTEVARVNGMPDTEVVVLPTALFVSTRGLGEIRTGAVSSGHTDLNFAQIDGLSEVVAGARDATSGPAGITAGLRELRQAAPFYRPWQRVIAYLMLSAALSVLLGASLAGVALAAALGAVVGAVLLASEQVARRYRSLVTVGAAFGVSVVVLTATSIGLDPGVLPSLVAPLVTFLPGALLTTGIIELVTGQMIAGAGRLAAGAMQLVLLATGIVAGAALVGVPQLDLSSARDPLGPLAPWLAVAVFGVALTVHQGGRPRTLGWILLVLYVAYGAQVVGDLFLGGVLSALVGAAAMTPAAILASRHPSGPAAFVSFLPAFYLLVPGALGLVGVASLLDGDVTGLSTLLVTSSTMVAISLGVLLGSALSRRLQHQHGLLL